MINSYLINFVINISNKLHKIAIFSETFGMILHSRTPTDVTEHDNPHTLRIYTHFGKLWENYGDQKGDEGSVMTICSTWRPLEFVYNEKKMDFEEKLQLILEKARNQLDNSEKFKNFFDFIFSNER